MALTRRLAAVVSLVIAGLLTFAATTVAFDLRSLPGASIVGKGTGGGGGLPAAGNYHNTFISTFLSQPCCGDPSLPQITVNVTDDTSTANPTGGPSTSSGEVDVQFNVCDFTSGLCGGGCFIPDGANDFTVNATVTSATLRTAVGPNTRSCQGSPLFGLPSQFSLSATWTVAGKANSSSSIGRYACLAYTSETLTKNSNSSNAEAVVSTSLLTGTFTVGGSSISSFDQTIHAQGVPADACSGLGGKGAGPGPQGAGDYTSASVSASMQVTPDDTSQNPYSIFVTTFTNTAHPVGGPLTSVTETDLNISQFSFFQFVRACYVLPAGAFTISSSLQTATLNASIVPGTTACAQADNSPLPSSFSINATWNATGPVATFRNQSSGGCGNFHTAGSQLQSSGAASATGSWPGVATTIADTQASAGSNNTNTHIQGVFNC